MGNDISGKFETAARSLEALGDGAGAAMGPLGAIPTLLANMADTGIELVGDVAQVGADVMRGNFLEAAGSLLEAGVDLAYNSVGAVGSTLVAATGFGIVNVGLDGANAIKEGIDNVIDGFSNEGTPAPARPDSGDVSPADSGDLPSPSTPIAALPANRGMARHS